MNTIKLCGGLGNQLFQYAFGRVQKENGITVNYDASWYNSKYAQNPLRTYALDKFYVDVNLGIRRQRKVISERVTGFDLSLLQKDGCYFSGYWQYPAYYKHILSILRKEFCIREELYTNEFSDLREEIITCDSTVSVHIRRGDYLYLNEFPTLPSEYYQEALKKVEGIVYVFSDDIQWCKDHFKEVRFIHLNEYFDFELMKLCKHNIISRSSFSWWAAYLNSNPTKVVVAPKQQIDCKVRKEAEERKSGIFDPKEWCHVN